MLESWFQATLQLYFVLYVLPDENDGWDGAFNIGSLAISLLSILYGISTYNLRKILRNEPNIRKTLLYALTELSTTAVIFLYLPSIYVLSWFLYKQPGLELYF